VSQERTLTCLDCGQTFPFTAEEQAFHAEKGFTNDPKRCPSCRAARRADRDSGASYGGSYRPAAREMFPVTCAQCGKQTEVPFQPSGDRPVYCRDCYDRRRQAGGNGRSRR